MSCAAGNKIDASCHGTKPEAERRRGARSELGLYEAYRKDLAKSRIAPATRSSIIMGVVIQNLFMVLDYFAYPDHFKNFVATRMVINLGFAVCYASSSRFPRAAMMGASYSLGLGMLALIYGEGANASAYYAGLILVFFGMGVLLPMSPAEAALTAGTMAGIFAVVPLAGLGELNESYGLNTFFVAAAAAEAIFCSFFLERMRFKDYRQQQQLIEAEAHLRELDKAKTRFSANIHHELRTPLTLMLAPLDGLRSGDYGDFDPLAERTFRMMHVNGQRLLKLINNLLDLAKLESKQFSIRRLPLDAGHVVRNIVESASPMAERKSIDLQAHVPAEKLSINADGDALEKILVNLVGNALKFTEPGGTIDVAVSTTEDGVEFSVRDSGIGLEAAQLGRVFDRFAQVDSSATRQHEGTGIGLSLTQELVELHGGQIWAESIGLGHGSTMRFTLPHGEPDHDVAEAVVATAASGEVAASESLSAVRAEMGQDLEASGFEAKSSASSTYAELERSAERWEGQSDPPAQRGEARLDKRPRVLVADDNADMRELISFILQKDFRVRTARNGREALEILQEYRPNLIVSDIMMPEMSGKELCAAVKSDDRLEDIPVMLVSSKAESEMKIEGLEMGADDYVTKPFHPRELLARARSQAALHQTRVQLARQNLELSAAIRDLQRAEAQLVHSERLAAVGEMAAGIAHEVNNPINFALNAVRSLTAAVDELRTISDCASAIDWDDAVKVAEQASALKDRIEYAGGAELSETIVELAAIVTNGLERTHRLVVDLRDFASPGRERARSETDLREVVASTLNLVSHDLHRSGVSVDVDYPEQLSPVEGDPGALNQVVLNLIKNAVDATGNSAGAVEISFQETTGHVMVEIVDHGCGIEPAIADRIFEPFFTTKDAGKGTGLGLAMCSNIVNAHGGSIQLDSEPGHGSKFTVCLPSAGSNTSDEDDVIREKD